MDKVDAATQLALRGGLMGSAVKAKL